MESKRKLDFILSSKYTVTVFSFVINYRTRRSGGMHYTSIENIHKVIDPLFYNALAAELDEITAIAVKKTRDTKLGDFQKKLASLTFLEIIIPSLIQRNGIIKKYALAV